MLCEGGSPTILNHANRLVNVKNRADIQWLRAIAVSMVVLFHLWPSRFTGGFAGVDVFFVISGYLITGGLLRERPRLGDFWLRRIRRLLPSALLVILVTLVAAAVLVPAGSRTDFGTDAIASTLYFENWWLIGSAADYFAATAPSPFQHFWSLAVEEQFYLVWPVLVVALSLWGASRGSVIRARVVFGVVALGSFGWSLWQSHAEPTVAYLSTFTRAWEFAVGALIATGLGFARLSVRLRLSVSLVGFALIGVSTFGLSEHMVFPGWAALWPVLGTALVIASFADYESSPRLNSLMRPVRWLGDISYGLYLWHWPVVVLVGGYVLSEHESIGRFGPVLMLGLSVALAWLSKRWVEDPIRSSLWLKRRARWAQYAAAFSATIAIVLIGYALQDAAKLQLAAAQSAAERQAVEPCFGANSLLPSSNCKAAPTANIVPELDVAKHDAADPGSVCMTKAEDTDVKLCEYGSERAGAYRVLLVGDSHAATHLAAFQLFAKRNGWHLTLAYHAGCSFSLVERNDTARGVACAAWNIDLQKRLVAAQKFDLVVTAQYAKNRLADVKGVATTVLADGLAAAWQPLLDRGSEVVVIRDNPEMTPAMKACWDSATKIAISCMMPQSKAFVTDPAAQAAANTDSVKLLDLTDLYCQNGICPAEIGGVYIYRNADHINATYSRSMTLALDQRLERLLGSR